MTQNDELQLIGKPFAYEPSGAPVYLSGGRALTLRMSVENDTGTIYLDDGNTPKSVIATGPVSRIARDYASACRPSRKSGRSMTDVVLLVLIGIAVMALSVSALNGAMSKMTAPTEAETLASPISDDDAFVAFMNALRHRGGQGDGQALPLPVPGGNQQARPNVQVPVGVSPDRTDRFNLPPYRTPGQPADDADELLPLEDGGPVNIPAPSQDPVAAPETGTDSGDAASAKEAGPGAAVAEEPAGSAMANGEPAAAETEVDTAAAAREAAQEMVSGGMTPETAMNVLAMLEELGGSETVTPEMLSQLPHEVARLLVEGGLVDESAPGGTPYSIIRIPGEILDSHRGPDGIPSIPDRDSWASTGNFVNIPLPGGGDIGKPEDMLEFGLQP